MNNTIFIYLLFLPLFLAGQPDTTDEDWQTQYDEFNRHWSWVDGLDSAQLARSEENRTLYKYVQENKQCASFFVDGREINVEIMPERFVREQSTKEVFETCFRGDLPPALIVSGEVVILCRNPRAVIPDQQFYYPQKLLIQL